MISTTEVLAWCRTTAGLFKQAERNRQRVTRLGPCEHAWDCAAWAANLDRQGHLAEQAIVGTLIEEIE